MQNNRLHNLDKGLHGVLAVKPLKERVLIAQWYLTASAIPPATIVSIQNSGNTIRQPHAISLFCNNSPFPNIFACDIFAITIVSQLANVHTVAHNTEKVIHRVVAQNIDRIPKDVYGGQEDVLNDQHVHLVFGHELVRTTNRHKRAVEHEVGFGVLTQLLINIFHIMQALLITPRHIDTETHTAHFTMM